MTVARALSSPGPARLPVRPGVLWLGRIVQSEHGFQVLRIAFKRLSESG